MIQSATNPYSHNVRFGFDSTFKISSVSSSTSTICSFGRYTYLEARNAFNSSTVHELLISKSLKETGHSLSRSHKRKDTKILSSDVGFKS